MEEVSMQMTPVGSQLLHIIQGSKSWTNLFFVLFTACYHKEKKKETEKFFKKSISKILILA